MKAALKDARVPVPPEEAQAWRHCLHILSPLHTARDRECMSTNIEKIINQPDGSLLAFHVTDLGALFFPDDSARGQALGRQMQAAVITGELASIVPDKQHVFISDLAAWPACPPLPASSPLRYWLPFMPTLGLVESVSSPDGTTDDTPSMETGADAKPESREQRQDRRLGACIAAGLLMPDSACGRLPDGVGKVAAAEGVTRQTFSDDVKAAMQRRDAKRREGVTSHRIK